MQIRTQKVKLSDTDIKRIYFEAFPKKERMPFPMMVAMSKLWNTQFFAVDKCLRSKGYGSSILHQLKNKYPDKKIIISIEPCDDSAPDIALRKRRKSFYMQNGYKETGYLMKLNGIVQEIIIINGEFVKSII